MKYNINRYLALIAGLLMAIQVDAQQFSMEYQLDLSNANRGNYLLNINTSDIKTKDFVAVSVIIEGNGINASDISGVLNAGRQYSIIPGHDSETENRFVSELYFIDKSKLGQWQLKLDVSHLPRNIDYKGRLRIFVPDAQSHSNEPNMKNSTVAQCECIKLPFVSRTEWGARFHLDENIYIPPASYTKVTHLIVHHSAGPNASSNWADVVASYFDYHVNSNGWQDIGYNWLIDPNGVIYEGRGGGENVVGAHMCGYNKNTMGVCMLGDFELISPPDTMMQTLYALLGYKACLDSIDPEGEGDIGSYSGHLLNISGHKDGCAIGYTTCPGKYLYEKLELVRKNTAKYIEEQCNETSSTTDFAQEDVLYPNPADNRICGLYGTAVVLDLHGHNVMSQVKKEYDGCLNIESLPSGIYIVKMQQGTSSRIAKFIKQ